GAPADRAEAGLSWRTISPGRNDTHRHDPLRADPSQGDPLRADPFRGDPPHGAPSRSHPLRDDQVRAAPPGDAAFGAPGPQDAPGPQYATTRDATIRGPQQPGDPNPPRPAARHALGSGQP